MDTPLPSKWTPGHLDDSRIRTVPDMKVFRIRRTWKRTTKTVLVGTSVVHGSEYSGDTGTIRVLDGGPETSSCHLIPLSTVTTSVSGSCFMAYRIPNFGERVRRLQFLTGSYWEMFVDSSHMGGVYYFRVWFSTRDLCLLRR